MEISFVKRLHQFVLAVDIVDSRTKEEVLSKIQDYLEKLGINRFVYFVEAIVENTLGLEKGLTPNDEDAWTGRIKDKAGQYLGQTSYAYDTRGYLWVVGANKEHLLNTKIYEDFWSNKKDIPKYSPKSGSCIEGDMRTAIYVPLIFGKKTVGIANFESKEFMPWNPALAEELKLIAEISGKLYQLYKAHSVQKDYTKRALKNIEVPKTPKIPEPIPGIFIAFPEKADKNLIEIIKSTIKDRYTGKLSLYTWDEEQTPGSITENLIKKIPDCKYGIFYFSEITDEEPDVKYQDNSNVLFEAGMFHILSSLPDNIPEGWIPIRESQEFHIDKEPFDFRNERKLEVKRKNGKVDEKDFKKQLTEKINSLLGI